MTAGGNAVNIAYISDKLIFPPDVKNYSCK